MPVSGAFRGLRGRKPANKQGDDTKIDDVLSSNDLSHEPSSKTDKEQDPTALPKQIKKPPGRIQLTIHKTTLRLSSYFFKLSSDARTGRPQARGSVDRVVRGSSAPPPLTSSPVSKTPQPATTQPSPVQPNQNVFTPLGDSHSETHTASEAPSPLFDSSVSSIWKRLSQAASMPSMSTAKNSGSIDKPGPSSEHAHGENVQFLEGQSESVSEHTDSPSTPIDSIETPCSFIEVAGIAGIGIRDRSSISLHSLPSNYLEIGASVPAQSSSRMSYVPPNSSPLSSRINSTDGSERTPRKHKRASLRPPSAQYRTHRESYYASQMIVVPDQSKISQGDLMKILRGPSSYPVE